MSVGESVIVGVWLGLSVKLGVGVTEGVPVEVGEMVVEGVMVIVEVAVLVEVGVAKTVGVPETVLEGVVSGVTEGVEVMEPLGSKGCCLELQAVNKEAVKTRSAKIKTARFMEFFRNFSLELNWVEPSVTGG